MGVIKMKLQEIVNAIADDFQSDMKDNNFDTFTEMKACYWWGSKDIKVEVDYMCCHMFDIPTDYNYNYGLDDLDEYLSYNKLIRKVYSELKKRNVYGDED